MSEDKRWVSLKWDQPASAKGVALYTMDTLCGKRHPIVYENDFGCEEWTARSLLIDCVITGTSQQEVRDRIHKELSGRHEEWERLSDGMQA